MTQTKVSPDEKITAIALENVDPFARKGVKQAPLNQHKPRPRRDFSKYDQPDDVIASAAENPPPAAEPAVKLEEEPAKEPKKRGRQPKPQLEETLPPTAADVEVKIVDSRSQDGAPSYRCEFTGRDIFVGFLSYKNTNPITTMALTAMALDFGRDKIRFDLECGNSDVAQARNNLVLKFLETDAKYLFMMDDDIIPCIGRPLWMQAWVPSARLVNERPLQRHVLSRLVNSEKSVIGAAYFERRETDVPRIVCSNQKLAPRAKTYEDAVVEVDWIGGGAMLIHRSVFEDIDKREPELNKNFFHPIAPRVGEDVSFCQRAKSAGHSIYIDLGVPTFHVGNKTY